MALSVVALKTVKGRDKTYKLTGSDDLYLLVTSTGARYWRS
ncbi:MAG: Integrase [Sphingomonadales bacterium]|nr:Integrase [Sphingomonadales bacterium]